MKKWFQKAMALLMSVTMLTSLCAPALAVNDNALDVSADSTFAAYIQKVIDAGLMQGYGDGTFGPDDPLTRGMFITVLYRLAGEPDVEGKATFADVAAGKYYSDAVKWAEDNGIAKGYGDGIFGANALVTRQHMAVFLYRYAWHTGRDGIIPSEGSLDAFADAASVDEYAQEAMRWVVGEGILLGNNGYLDPYATAARAHAAAVICRYMSSESAGNSGGVTDSGDVTDDDDMSAEKTAYTREELEAALVETAWAYYLKGEKVQYDSINLTSTSAMNEGVRRLPLVSTLENATEDSTVYTVCSDYCWNVYQNTLGLPLFGDRRNASTAGIWWLSESYGMVVARWEGENYVNTAEDDKYGVTDKDILSTSEMMDFISSYKENLRPGDILTFTGHSMLYIGNGYVLDSNGSKYSLSTGKDAYEQNGTVNHLHSVGNLFINGGSADKYSGYYKLDSSSNAGKYLVITRPLDALCIDDGDADPANDLLDEDYVMPQYSELNPGVNLLYNPDAPMSGYTITETTLSRMEYPAMDIDRTVDITQYGTAVKGGQLTYSVKIYNKSTDAAYCTYQTADKGETYAGSAYEDLVVTETIPAGTELVSTDGVVSGDTITWAIDVAAGEMVECAYIVKVIGEIGDVIVNDGGMVANIPSNSISNTIGGEKVGADILTKLQTAYDSTAAIELAIPTVQELINNIFSVTKIESKNGYMTRYDQDTYYYAYTLKDTADSAYQKYLDMVVQGYLGGLEVHTDPNVFGNRITEFSVDYLEPGDVLIYADLDGSNQSDAARNVTESKTVVYVGDGKFVAASSDGTTVATDETAVIWEALKYDVMFALRPSQASENVDAAFYTVGTGSGSSGDGGSGDSGDDGGTTETGLAALAVLTGADVMETLSLDKVGLNLTGAMQMYQAAGMNISGLVTVSGSVKTAANVRDALFASGSLCTEVPEGYEPMYNALVAGAYGGTMITETGLDALTLADLQLGDIFVLHGVNEGTGGKSVFWVGVYQGNGQFLMSKTYSPGVNDSAQHARGATVNYTADTFASEVADEFWKLYFVMRPSQACDDITAAEPVWNTTVGSGSGSDDSTSAVMSAANQAAVTALTGASVMEKLSLDKVGLNLTGAMQMYQAAGMDISGLVTVSGSVKTVANVRDNLFAGGALCTEIPAGFEPMYHAVLKDCYGGTKITETGLKPLAQSDLQIGDIFCMYEQIDSANVFWVGVYQGNGQFLMSQTGLLDDTADRTRGVSVSFSSFENLMSDWTLWFVLRPAQACDDINAAAPVWKS